MEHNPTESRERLNGLETDAAALMQELSSLSTRLKDLGRTKAGELGREAEAQVTAQLDALRSRLAGLSTDSEQVLASLDKSVRANPYLFIAGALGLGVLLGKALRS